MANRAGSGIKQTQAYVYRLDHELSLAFLSTYVKSFQYMLAIVIFHLIYKCSTEMLTFSTVFDAVYQGPGIY